jgi:hypothetical protein
MQTRIRINDERQRTQALCYLAGEYTSTSMCTGKLAVPFEALTRLAQQGISFVNEGIACNGTGEINTEEAASIIDIPPGRVQQLCAEYL